MPPGQMESWLVAVSQQLPAAAIGRLLLCAPNVDSGSPTTAQRAMSLAVDVLGVSDPAAFCVDSPGMLYREVPALQRNLNSLQQTLGWTAEQARQLVLKQPALLIYSPGTVQASLAWLGQLFPDADQLAGVIDHGPRLLGASVQPLQSNANCLQQELGWQDGHGQLAALITAHPYEFVICTMRGERTEHKLQLLSEVVGVSRRANCHINAHQKWCFGCSLLQERAPEPLRNKADDLGWSTAHASCAARA